jgi:hypothetical protein
MKADLVCAFYRKVNTIIESNGILKSTNVGDTVAKAVVEDGDGHLWTVVMEENENGGSQNETRY